MTQNEWNTLLQNRISADTATDIVDLNAQNKIQEKAARLAKATEEKLARIGNYSATDYTGTQRKHGQTVNTTGVHDFTNQQEEFGRLLATERVYSGAELMQGGTTAQLDPTKQYKMDGSGGYAPFEGDTRNAYIRNLGIDPVTGEQIQKFGLARNDLTDEAIAQGITPEKARYMDKERNIFERMLGMNKIYKDDGGEYDGTPGPAAQAQGDALFEGTFDKDAITQFELNRYMDRATIAARAMGLGEDTRYEDFGAGGSEYTIDKLDPLFNIDAPKFEGELPKGTQTPTVPYGYNERGEKLNELDLLIQKYSKPKEQQKGVYKEAKQTLAGGTAGLIKGAVELADVAQELATWGPQAIYNKITGKNVDIDLIPEDFKKIVRAGIDDVVGYEAKADEETMVEAKALIKETGINLFDTSTYSKITDAKNLKRLGSVIALFAKNPSLTAGMMTEIIGAGGVAGAGVKVGAKIGSKIAPQVTAKIESAIANNATKISQEMKAVEASTKLSKTEKAAELAKLKNSYTIGKKTSDILKGTAMTNADMAIRMNQWLDKYKDNNKDAEGNEVAPSIGKLVQMGLMARVASAAEVGSMKLSFGLKDGVKQLTEASKSGIMSAITKAAKDYGTSIPVEAVQETFDGIVETIATKEGASKYEGKTIKDLLEAESTNILTGTFAGGAGGFHMTSAGKMVDAVKGAPEAAKKGAELVTETKAQKELRQEREYSTPRKEEAVKAAMTGDVDTLIKKADEVHGKLNDTLDASASKLYTYGTVLKEALAKATVEKDETAIDNVYKAMAELDKNENVEFAIKDIFREQDDVIAKEIMSIINSNKETADGKMEELKSRAKDSIDAKVTATDKEINDLRIMKEVLQIEKKRRAKIMGSDTVDGPTGPIDDGTLEKLDAVIDSYMTNEKSIDDVNKEFAELGYIDSDGKADVNRPGLKVYESELTKQLLDPKKNNNLLNKKAEFTQGVKLTGLTGFAKSRENKLGAGKAQNKTYIDNMLKENDAIINTVANLTNTVKGLVGKSGVTEESKKAYLAELTIAAKAALNSNKELIARQAILNSPELANVARVAFAKDDNGADVIVTMSNIDNKWVQTPIANVVENGKIEWLVDPQTVVQNEPTAPTTEEAREYTISDFTNASIIDPNPNPEEMEYVAGQEAMKNKKPTPVEPTEPTIPVNTPKFAPIEEGTPEYQINKDNENEVIVDDNGYEEFSKSPLAEVRKKIKNIEPELDTIVKDIADDVELKGHVKEYYNKKLNEVKAEKTKLDDMIDRYEKLITSKEDKIYDEKAGSVISGLRMAIDKTLNGLLKIVRGLRNKLRTSNAKYKKLKSKLDTLVKMIEDIEADYKTTRETSIGDITTIDKSLYKKTVVEFKDKREILEEDPNRPLAQSTMVKEASERFVEDKLKELDDELAGLDKGGTSLGAELLKNLLNEFPINSPVHNIIRRSEEDSVFGKIKGNTFKNPSKLIEVLPKGFKEFFMVNDDPSDLLDDFKTMEHYLDNTEIGKIYVNPFVKDDKGDVVLNEQGYAERTELRELYNKSSDRSNIDGFGLAIHQITKYMPITRELIANDEVKDKSGNVYKVVSVKDDKVTVRKNKNAPSIVKGLKELQVKELQETSVPLNIIRLIGTEKDGVLELDEETQNILKFYSAKMLTDTQKMVGLILGLDEAEMGKVLGIYDVEEQMAIKEAAKNGYVNSASIRKDIGSEVYQALGIKFTKETPEFTEESFKTALGLLVQGIAINNESMIVEKTTDKNDKNRNMIKTNWDNVAAGENNPENYRGSLIKAISKLQYLNENRNRPLPSKKSLNVPKARMIMNTTMAMDDKSKEFIDNQEKTAYTISPAIKELLAMDEKDVLKSRGYIDIENTNVHVSKIDGILARNDKLVRELNILKTFAKAVGDDKFYLSWGQTVSGRFTILNDLNYQESKLHREFVVAEGSTVKVDPNNKDARQMLEASILQGLDMDPDKLSAETASAKFNETFAITDKGIEVPNRLNKKYKGKVILANAGTGKSVLAKQVEDVVDGDELLIQAVNQLLKENPTHKQIKGVSVLNDVWLSWGKDSDDKKVLSKYEKLRAKVYEIQAELAKESAAEGNTVLIASSRPAILEIVDTIVYQGDTETLRKSRASNDRENVLLMSAKEVESKNEKFLKSIEGVKDKVVELEADQFLGDIMLENNPIKTAYDALKAGKFDADAMAEVFNDSEGHHGISSIELLVKWDKALQDGSEVETHANLEIDAITSGMILTLLQIGTKEAIKMAEKGGIYREDRIEALTAYVHEWLKDDTIKFTPGALIEAGKAHAAVIEEKINNTKDPIELAKLRAELENDAVFKDLYSTIGVAMIGKVQAYKEKLQKNPKRNESEEMQLAMLNQIGELNLKNIRSIAKSPVMVFIYGATIKSIKKKLTYSLGVDTLVKALERASSNLRNGEKVSKDDVSFIEMFIPKGSEKYVDYLGNQIEGPENNAERLLAVEINKDVIDRIESAINATFGDAIEESFESRLGFVNKNRDAVKTVEILLFEAYKIRLSEEIDKLLDRRYGKNKHKGESYKISKKDLAEINDRLTEQGYGHNIVWKDEDGSTINQPLDSSSGVFGTHSSLVKVGDTVQRGSIKESKAEVNTGAAPTISIHAIDGRLMLEVLNRRLDKYTGGNIYDAVVLSLEKDMVVETSDSYNTKMIETGFSRSILVDQIGVLENMLATMSKEQLTKLTDSIGTYAKENGAYTKETNRLNISIGKMMDLIDTAEESNKARVENSGLEYNVGHFYQMGVNVVNVPASTSRAKEFPAINTIRKILADKLESDMKETHAEFAKAEVTLSEGTNYVLNLHDLMQGETQVKSNANIVQVYSKNGKVKIKDNLIESLSSNDTVEIIGAYSSDKDAPKRAQLIAELIASDANIRDNAGASKDYKGHEYTNRTLIDDVWVKNKKEVTKVEDGTTANLDTLLTTYQNEWSYVIGDVVGYVGDHDVKYTKNRRKKVVSESGEFWNDLGFSKVEVSALKRYNKKVKEFATKKITEFEKSIVKKLSKKTNAEINASKIYAEEAHIENYNNALGSGTIYDVKDYGITDKELSSIQKANDEFFKNNPKVKLTAGDKFEYNDGTITFDETEVESNQIVYIAHEIIHAKTSEWLDKNSNKSIVKKLRAAVDSVINELNNKPVMEITEEEMLLLDRLEWDSGQGKDGLTKENVAILAAEPAVRNALIKLLPKTDKSIITKILNAIKEWLNMETQLDAEQILELVDAIVNNSTKEGVKQQDSTINPNDTIPTTHC